MEISINDAIGVLTLDKIIDRNPVTVKPDTSVQNAIELMSGVRNKGNPLETNNNSFSSLTKADKQSSYLLVMEEEEIVGIFTEKDVVKLIAAGTDLSDKKISEFMLPNAVVLKQYHNRDVLIAMRMMREYKTSHLPVVTSWGKLIGIITYENIRSALTPGCLLKMRNVFDVMETEVIHSDENLSLMEVAKLMCDRQVSYAVIVEKKTSSKSDRTITIPVGILTEQDLVKFRFLQLDFVTTQAKDVMSQPLSLVNPEDSLWQAHCLMLTKQLRRLVVTSQTGELAGILTQSNILQVFNPLEMSRVVTVLRYQVETRTKELEQTNQKLKQAYEELKQKEREQRLTLESQESFKAYIANLVQEFNRINFAILNNVATLDLKFPRANPEIKLLLENLKDNSERGIQLVEPIFSCTSSSNFQADRQKLVPPESNKNQARR